MVAETEIFAIYLVILAIRHCVPKQTATYLLGSLARTVLSCGSFDRWKTIGPAFGRGPDFVQFREGDGEEGMTSSPWSPTRLSGGSGLQEVSPTKTDPGTARYEGMTFSRYPPALRRSCVARHYLGHSQPRPEPLTGPLQSHRTRNQSRVQRPKRTGRSPKMPNRARSPIRPCRTPDPTVESEKARLPRRSPWARWRSRRIVRPRARGVPIG